MQQLIIPNSYDVHLSLNKEETKKYKSRNWRYIWLMNAGDAIIVPDDPVKGFLDYFADIKKEPHSKFQFVLIEEVVSEELLIAPSLIKKLKKVIVNPKNWVVNPFYYNRAIVLLNESLNLFMREKFKKLINENVLHDMNSKIEFRKFAAICDIPIPKGYVCRSLHDFKSAAINLFSKTQQIIIKKYFSGGGQGNIGIGLKSTRFSGTAKNFFINSSADLESVVNQIWSQEVDELNQTLIVEIFYPNSRAFTCEMLIPRDNNYPEILNYGELRHTQKSIVGIETPSDALKSYHICELLDYSLRLAKLLQTLGYNGYMSCDAIKTENKELLLTEINARMSGAMPAYVLAEHFFGKEYINKITFLSRFIKIPSFMQAYRLLKKEKLLFNNECGVIFVYANDSIKEAEILVIAQSSKKAYDIERRAIKILSKM